MAGVEGGDGEGDRQIHIRTSVIPGCPVGRQKVFIDLQPTHDPMHLFMTRAEDRLHPLFDFQTAGANGDDVKIQSGTCAVGIAFAWVWLPQVKSSPEIAEVKVVFFWFERYNPNGPNLSGGLLGHREKVLEIIQTGGGP